MAKKVKAEETIEVAPQAVVAEKKKLQHQKNQNGNIEIDYIL